MMGREFRCEMTSRGTAHAGYVRQGTRRGIMPSLDCSTMSVAITEKTSRGAVVGVTASRGERRLLLVVGRCYEVVVKNVLPTGTTVALASDQSFFGIVPASKGRDFEVGNRVQVAFNGPDRRQRTLLFRPVG